MKYCLILILWVMNESYPIIVTHLSNSISKGTSSHIHKKYNHEKRDGSKRQIGYSIYVAMHLYFKNSLRLKKIRAINDSIGLDSWMLKKNVYCQLGSEIFSPSVMWIVWLVIYQKMLNIWHILVAWHPDNYYILLSIIRFGCYICNLWSC